MLRIPEWPSEKIWPTKSWYVRRKGDKMRTLKEIPCGESVKVTKLTGEGAVKRRIMDMGITKGIDIFVRKTAPAAESRCGNDFGGIKFFWTVVRYN